MRSKDGHNSLSVRGPAAARHYKRTLLVVDPDPLTCWCIQTYLGRWFDVAGTTSPDEADRLLDQYAFDALVISESLRRSTLARVEDLAHRRGADVMIVQTFSDSSACLADEHVAHLEKPFELSRLAHILGVPDSAVPST